LFIPALFCLVANGQVTGNSEIPVLKKLPDQPRFYVTIHGGYAVALGSTFKFYPDDIKSIRAEKLMNDPEKKVTEYKAVKKGLGEGFRGGVGFSYIVNDFINVGLDLDYFQSTIHKDKDSSYREVNSSMNPAPNEKMYNERVTISYKTSLLTFVPNITFKAISRPKFFIYNKIGAVLTFRPNSVQKETLRGNERLGWQGFYKDSSFSKQTSYDWGIMNPSFGFMGGIGTQIKLRERIRAFGELQFTHIVFRTKSRSLTSMKVNGKEMANTLTVSQREIEFNKDFTDTQTGNNPNKPMQAVVQRFPISYVGLQIGLAYRF
ncbi:MAG: hypothetical protein ABIR18_12435, partial [Chitinophagaceae bacterium]